jgi:hypothetical protein
LELQNEHIHRYASETVTIRTRLDEPVLQGRNKMHPINLLVAPIVFVPLLAILSSCGGNVMLTIFVVMALVPLGYIFVKFF